MDEIFEDSVLCLVKMSDPAEAKRRWENEEEEFQQSDSHREFFGVDGEPIEFEWNIFPGLTSLEFVHEIQKDLQKKTY